MATAMCEKHGLRYDPSVHAGCVMCRRETGEATMAHPPAGAKSARPGDRSILPALVFSVLLWLTFGFVLFSAHQKVVKMGESMMSQQQDEGAEVATRPMSSQDEQTQQVMEELERMNHPDGGSGETAAAPPPPASLDKVPATSPPRRPPPSADRPID